MAVIPTLKLFPYELERMEIPERIVEAATGDAVEQVRAYSQAGGQVLFGTDVGYMSDYDPTDEYRLMARALTPMQILATLTTAPAARWKEAARRGRVEAGRPRTSSCCRPIPRPTRRTSRRSAARSAPGGSPIHWLLRDNRLRRVLRTFIQAGTFIYQGT